MINVTMRNFGYPETLIAESEYWAVLLRPQQITLGNTILVCREDITSLGQMSLHASQEFSSMAKRLERSVCSAFGPQKFNYLALMMVDPNVHFHVIPRYEQSQHFEDFKIVDHGWPKTPELGSVTELSATQLKTIQLKLKSEWE